MVDHNSKKLTYEELSNLAASHDPVVRQGIAGRIDVEPEILYFLANDDVPEVRLSVALNPNSPPQIFTLLARDKDEKVREGLANKFSALAPDVGEEDLSQIWKITHSALQMLARDQVVVVRKALAEALKGFVSAPLDIIDELANDIETIVSAPVLEFSPVLNEKDLLDIISKGTASSNLRAISRRNEVTRTVSDAIIKSDDSMAIAELLANKSAQIREEVLDTLIDRAPEFEFWHAPLVARPILPKGAPLRLARFIADTLILKLKMRVDLDEASFQKISEIIQERFGEDYGSNDIHLTGNNLFDFLQAPLPMVRAKRLKDTGGLTDTIITKALQERDYLFVLAALATLSEYDEGVVKRIFKEQNPKAIVALVWKAGFLPAVIVDIQRQIARVAPDDVIKPDPLPDTDDVNYILSSLKFPLSEKEMEWSIQFFVSLVKRDS